MVKVTMIQRKLNLQVTVTVSDSLNKLKKKKHHKTQ